MRSHELTLGRSFAVAFGPGLGRDGVDHGTPPGHVGGDQVTHENAERRAKVKNVELVTPSTLTPEQVRAIGNQLADLEITPTEWTLQPVIVQLESATDSLPRQATSVF